MWVGLLGDTKWAFSNMGLRGRLWWVGVFRNSKWDWFLIHVGACGSQSPTMEYLKPNSARQLLMVV